VLPIQGSGDETRSFVYVDDLVDGVLRLIESGEHLNVYHVGTDAEVSIKDLVQALGRVMERPVVVETGPLQQGGTLRRCPNIDKLRALGYAPSVSLDEGLRRTVRWYTQHEKRTAK
jgi:UDP-glucose 4-epimerase